MQIADDPLELLRLISCDTDAKPAFAQSGEAIGRIRIKIVSGKFIGNSGAMALFPRFREIEPGPQDFENTAMMLAARDYR